MQSPFTLVEILNFRNQFTTFDTKKFEQHVAKQIKDVMNLDLPPHGECYNFTINYDNSEEPGLLQAIITDHQYIVAYYEWSNHKQRDFQYCTREGFISTFINSFRKYYEMGMIPMITEYCHSF